MYFSRCRSKNMKDSIKIFILFVILVIAVFLQHNLVKQSDNIEVPAVGNSQEANQETIVNLRIDFDNGNIKNYDSIKLGKEKTVFDLLKKVTEENNLEFSYKEYPDMGALIESIDNIKNDFKINKWWQYWVNGQYATQASDKYELKNGDLVEWKFIKGQF